MAPISKTAIVQSGVNTFKYMEVVEGRPEKLPPGVYRTKLDPDEPVFELIVANNDSPIEVDQTVKEFKVEVEDFLGKAKIFRKFGFPHRRGFLLYGAPGCGKSSALRLIEDSFVKNFKGLVLVWTPRSGSFSAFYEMVRRFEGEGTPILCVAEDIDNSMNMFEVEPLEFLDGHKALNNFILVATTNNLEAIPSRIKDRPSRIDRVIEIKLPSEGARAQYLRNFPLNAKQIKAIAGATDEMSMAALKEVVIATVLLGQDLTTVVARLKVLLAEDLVQPVTDQDEIEAL